MSNEKGCGSALGWLAGGLMLAGTLGGGCAHGRGSGAGADTFFLPEIPPFLSGPVSVLLTNAGGYSARLAMTSGIALGKPEVVSGELLERGGVLVFAPDKQATDKRVRSAGLSFIWDVRQNSGYMLSEALQGYAPVEFSVRYTNVVARSASAPERIQGHRCDEQEATVSSSEGSAAQVRVWRAEDLNGIALRIVTSPKPAPQILSLSKVRPGAPPADLFKPPEGFTRYENADSMMSELTVRQHNLKRHPTEDWTGSEEPSPGSPPSPRPR